MGLIGKIKSLVPVSSRSYHERTDNIEKTLEWTSKDRRSFELSAMQLLDRLAGEQERLRAENAALHAKNRIYLEELYRRDGETHFDARKRLFANLEPASGDMRLSQMGTARLMKVLDDACAEMGIDYWLICGSLVGALCCNGFIPWDDDIDIYVPRPDVERLIARFENDDEYQFTIVYDRTVFVRQLRFSSRNDKVPSFVDVAPVDYAVDASKESNDAARKLRLDLMNELASSGEYDYWKEFPLLFAPGSGFCVQYRDVDPSLQDPDATRETAKRIEDTLARYRQRARDMGLFCDEGEAKGIAYGLENIYDAPWRCTVWERDLVLPPRRHAFERYQFLVPNRPEEVAAECYPNYPFIGDGLLSDGHFPQSVFAEDGVHDAMREFIARAE